MCWEPHLISLRVVWLIPATSDCSFYWLLYDFVWSLLPKGVCLPWESHICPAHFLKVLYLLRSNEIYLVQSQGLSSGFLTMTLHQVQALSYTRGGPFCSWLVCTHGSRLAGRFSGFFMGDRGGTVLSWLLMLPAHWHLCLDHWHFSPAIGIM